MMGKRQAAYFQHARVVPVRWPGSVPGAREASGGLAVLDTLARHAAAGFVWLVLFFRFPFLLIYFQVHENHPPPVGRQPK